MPYNERNQFQFNEGWEVRDGEVLNAEHLNSPNRQTAEGLTEAATKFGGVTATNIDEAKSRLGISTSAGARTITLDNQFLTDDDVNKTIYVNGASQITLPLISTLSVTDTTEKFIKIQNLSNNALSVHSQRPDQIVNPDIDTQDLIDQVTLNTRGQAQRFVARIEGNNSFWYQEFPETAPVFQDSDSVWNRSSQGTSVKDDVYIGIVQETAEQNLETRESYKITTEEFARDVRGIVRESTDYPISLMILGPPPFDPGTPIVAYGVTIYDDVNNRSWDSRDIGTGGEESTPMPGGGDPFLTRIPCSITKTRKADGNDTIYVNMSQFAGYIDPANGWTLFADPMYAKIWYIPDNTATEE